MLLCVHLKNTSCSVFLYVILHELSSRHKTVQLTMRIPTCFLVPGSQSYTRNLIISLSTQITTFLSNEIFLFVCFLPERHSFVKCVQWLGACCVFADNQRQYYL